MLEISPLFYFNDPYKQRCTRCLKSFKTPLNQTARCGFRQQLNSLTLPSPFYLRLITSTLQLRNNTGSFSSQWTLTPRQVASVKFSRTLLRYEVFKQHDPFDVLSTEFSLYIKSWMKTLFLALINYSGHHDTAVTADSASDSCRLRTRTLTAVDEELLPTTV